MIDETQKNGRDVQDEHWDYVQLCAAWARELIRRVLQLADKLVNDVAHGRPFYSGYISGRSSNFGYPQVELGFAFFLIVPNNLQLSNNDRALFHSWQGMAVEGNMMRDTYERVSAIRGPLQDQIRENCWQKRTPRRRVATQTRNEGWYTRWIRPGKKGS